VRDAEGGGERSEAAGTASPSVEIVIARA